MVTVSLVRPVSAVDEQQASKAAAQAEAAQLDALVKKIQADAPATPRAEAPRPGGNVSQQLEEIAASHGAAAGAAAGEAPPSGEQLDDLRAQVRRCWKPISPTVVILDVKIDSEGRLASPPGVLRRAAATPEELRAESLAVQAAVRCAPYRSAAPLSGMQTFKVMFAMHR